MAPPPRRPVCRRSQGLDPRLDSKRSRAHNFFDERAMEQTLVLNATYEPLRIVSWQKAITLLFQGKVEVIAVYDREIRGVTVRVKLPSVLRLLRHVRMKRPFADVPFSRANVYARDDHRCQYCGRRLPPSQLTFDHVDPRRPRRPQGLGQHRHLLHPVQPQEGRPHARGDRAAPPAQAAPPGVAAVAHPEPRPAARSRELARLPLLGHLPGTGADPRGRLHSSP